MKRSERGYYGPSEGEWIFLLALLVVFSIASWEVLCWGFRKAGPHISVTWGEVSP